MEKMSISASSVWKYMLKLLHTIPTPFYESKYRPDSQRELAILFKLAKQNKIELLFLESLDSVVSLPCTFKELLIELRKKRLEMLITADRIIDVLEQLGYRASTFKSWTPFPAVPNDIDVIILDELNRREFRKLIQILVKKYSYHVFDVIPYAVSIHDSRCGNHLNPRVKDPYDIDLYLEVAANNIIYIDKRLLKRQLREISIDHVIQLYTLSDEHELLVQLTHSVIPEQIFLLYHYYTVIYLLNNINFEIVKKATRVTHNMCAVVLALDLALDLLNTIRNETIGSNRYRVREFLNKGYYRFKINEIFKCIAEKLSDERFTRSFVEQIVSLLKPTTLCHVTQELASRRIRTTY